MTRNRVLTICFQLVWFAAVVIPVSAQHFQQIPGSLSQVAAGRAEVWGVNASQKVYRFNASSKSFVHGSGWPALTQIAVGGGTLLQADEVWGVNASGGIYRFNFGTKAFAQVTGSLAEIVVGEGIWDKCHPYEVWGLNAAEQIYRYNYCTKVFDQIAGSLTHIATGGGSVWGLNGSAQIYYFSLFDQAFFQIPGTLQQIAVGVNDVWGLDGLSQLWHFDPGSGTFVQYDPSHAYMQLAAGGDGLWALDLNGETTRLLPSDPDTVSTFYANEGFVQIAAGYGAGVWEIDSSNRVYVFVRP